MTNEPRIRGAITAIVGTIGIVLVVLGAAPAGAADPITPTAPASDTSLPPGLPEAVAVVDPALGLGEPEMPVSPWFSWVVASTNVVVERTFIRHGTDGHPIGAVVVQSIGSNVWSGYGNDQGQIDIGADVDARLDAFGLGHRVVWERGDVHQAVDWFGDVSEAEGVALAGQVASGATLIVPGMVEVASPSGSLAVLYADGNEGTVAVTTYASDGPIDVEALAFSVTGAAEPAGDGIFDGSTAFTGRRLFVQVASTLVAEVFAFSDQIDIIAVARSLVTVPTSDFAGGPDFMLPPNVDRPPDVERRFGDATSGRWVLERWTGLSGAPCGVLVTEATGGVVVGGCASNWGVPLCALSVVYYDDRIDVAAVTDRDASGLTMWLLDGENREVAIDLTVETDAGGMTVATGSAPTTNFRDLGVRIDGDEVDCGDV